MVFRGLLRKRKDFFKTLCWLIARGGIILRRGTLGTLCNQVLFVDFNALSDPWCRWYVKICSDTKHHLDAPLHSNPRCVYSDKAPANGNIRSLLDVRPKHGKSNEPSAVEVTADRIFHCRYSSFSLGLRPIGIEMNKQRVVKGRILKVDESVTITPGRIMQEAQNKMAKQGKNQKHAKDINRKQTGMERVTANIRK